MLDETASSRRGKGRATPLPQTLNPKQDGGGGGYADTADTTWGTTLDKTPSSRREREEARMVEWGENALQSGAGTSFICVPQF